MNDDKFLIYRHTNKLNNKVYVGQTKQNFNQRCRKNGIGYKSSPHFYSAIEKYGWDNFTHEVLFTGLTQEEANKKEIELIAYYDATNPEKGYNISLGGDINPMLGKHHSEETKEKLRNKIVSEESRKKMSESAKERVKRDGAPFQGRKMSEEAKEKLRRVDKSYTQTKEYREKMSKATSGAKNGSAVAINAYDINGILVQEFGTILEALQFLGLSRSSSKFLKKAINNKEIYHQYIWRYKNDK